MSAVFAATPLSASADRRQTDATPATSDEWDAIGTDLSAVAPLHNLAAVEIVDGELSPIFAVNADEANAVGSSFKLYILAAAGEQVRDGVLSWDQPVEIEDRYKSVPGGDLRYVDAGTRFTMRYLAERMIQKSDNTATDHLIALVGRKAVEEMFVTAGHADPDLNIPLLTTREFAMLKLFVSEDVLERYLAADVPTRREILETEIDTLDYEEMMASIDETEPLEIDREEWFASPNDLTRVMLTLKTMAESDFALQPLLEVIALETQIPLDGEIWPYAGFKGGSEMGVLHGTWLLRRADDRWFVLSIGFNDPAAELDLDAAVGVMVQAFDVLAGVE
jgi:hypothetical protein